ncbi:MAG: hypothetical protein WDW36_009661 [Sanguina aurantia]
MALPITVWEFNRSGFDTHHQAWFVGGIFVLMAIPISVYEVAMHTEYYTRPRLQRHVIRILWMVPIYALDAWLALRFTDAREWLHPLRECYEAYVIYNFFAYLMAYLEEEYGDVEAYCLTKPDLAPMPVVGRFLKPQPMGPQFLWGCKKGVLNYVILRPLCTIIALIASRYGVYGQGQIDPYKAYIYLAAVTNISQLWALLCLVNFYNAMHEELAPIRPLSKFITIKAIVFMTFWQGIVITLLVSVGVIQRDPWDPRFDATDVASGIQDFLICIEMFIAALAQAYAFPPRDYMADDSAGEPQPGFMKNVRHMFDLRDVAEDVGDVLGDHVEHVSSAAHTVISVPGKAVKGIVQGPANLMNLFNGAGSGSSKRPSSKHRLLPEDDEEGVSSSSSSSRATSLVATARAGSTHELLEHDTTRQHPSRSSQHQGTPAAAASARPHGGSSGSGPRAGVALSTFAGPSGGSYAAAVAGASGAGDPGVGLSGGGGGRRRASSSTGGVAGGGAHGSPGHPLPAAGGGGPFGGLSSEQSGASFGSILSSDSRREPFIPVNDGDEEDQGAGRRGPGDEFSAAGAVSSDGGGGASPHAHHIVSTSSSSLSGHSSSPHGGAPHPHADQGLHTASIHYQPRHHPASLLRHQPSGAGAASQRRHHPHHDQHVRPLHTHPGAATDTRMATPHRNAHTQPSSSAAPSGSQPGESQDGEVAPAHGLEDAEGAAGPVMPAHAAAYLPAKQATGRDDGREALSQKERYVDKVSGGQGPGLRGGYQDTLWWEKLLMRCGSATHPAVNQCRNAMLIAVAAVTFSAVAAVGAASSRHGLRSTPHAAEPHTLPAWCVWPPPRRCGSVPGGAPAGTGACAMSRRGEVSRPCAALHVRHTSACEHAHPQGRRHKALAGVLCALCGGAAPASTQPTARRLALGHRALTGSAKGSLAPGHRALTGSAKGSLAPGHRALSGSAKGSLAPGHRALSGSAKGSLAPGHRALTGSAKGSLASSHRALTGSAKGSLAPGHRALTGSAKGSLACAECTPATGRGRVRERDSQEERPTAGRNLVAVGGTGAAGGAVILVANARAVSMRGIPQIVRAPRGGKGGRNGRSGHVGPDRIIEVPLGTVVRLLPPRSAEDEEAEEEEDRRRRGEVQGVDVDADSDDDEDEGEVVGDAGSRIRHMGRGPLDIQGPPRGRSESKGNRGMPAYSPANERQRAAAAAAPMGDPILGSDGESEEEEGGTGGGRRVLHRVWGQRARKQTEARLLHEAQQAWLEQQKLEREAVFGDLDDEQEWRQRQRQQRQQQLQQDKSWRGSNDEKEWRRQEQLSLQGGMGSDSDPAPETGTGPAQAGHSGEVRLFDEFGTQGVGDETAATETRRGRQRQRRPSSAAAEEEIEVEGPVLVAQSTAEAETSGPASPAVDRSDLPPLPDWRYGPGSGSGSGSGGGSGKHSASRGGGSSEGGRKKRGAAKQRAGSDQAALDSMDEKEWLAMTKTHRQADHVEEDRETTGAASPTGSRTSRSSGSSSFSGGPSGLFSSFQRPAGDDASAGEQGKDAGWGWQPGGTTSGAAGAMDPGPSASGSRGSESDPESAGRPSLRYRAGAGGIEVVGVGGGLEGAVNSELDRKAAARAERRRVREEAAVEIADLSIDGQRLVLAAGGSGGRGNMALPNPGPNRAASSCKELGEGGALVEVILESKSLADVGFVGMPNAGKSTLLAALTAARAQIGSYAFTTLRPQVGALHFEDDDSLLLLADIPGLLGGAHANVGRGNAFLRHVERTRCLAYIVDLSGGSAPSSLLQLTASQQLAVLQDEVTRYRAFLSDLPALVIANKVDATPNPLAALAALKASTLLPIVPVSGVSGVGLPRLKAALRMVAGKAPLPAAAVGARSAATVGGPQRFTVNDAKAGGRQRANSSVNATCVPEIAQSHIPPASASYPTPSPMNPRKRVDPFDPSPRSGYLSWDDYFMAVAFLSSQRSKDPNKQVGACIVSAEQVILGIGYNGFPRGCPDSTLPWAKKSASGDPLDTKYPYVVHAEANALLNKNAASVKGACVYVTMFPCNECAKLLIQAGITEVIYHEGKVEEAVGLGARPQHSLDGSTPAHSHRCHTPSKPATNAITAAPARSSPSHLRPPSRSHQPAAAEARLASPATPTPLVSAAAPLSAAATAKPLSAGATAAAGAVAGISWHAAQSSPRASTSDPRTAHSQEVLLHDGHGCCASGAISGPMPPPPATRTATATHSSSTDTDRNSSSMHAASGTSPEGPAPHTPPAKPGCDHSPRDSDGSAPPGPPAMNVGWSAGDGEAAVARGGAVAPSAAVAVADPHQPDPCYLASKRLLQLAGVGLRQHRLVRTIMLPCDTWTD